ncbi:MAG: hypothetical protein JWN94_1207, partial [Betaproteobacteria bacterium]|nr:hypothetical protein [Betaproteobacteria bacterium]
MHEFKIMRRSMLYLFSGGMFLSAAANAACVEASTGRWRIFVLAGS